MIYSHIPVYILRYSCKKYGCECWYRGWRVVAVLRVATVYTMGDSCSHLGIMVCHIRFIMLMFVLVAKALAGFFRVSITSASILVSTALGITPGPVCLSCPYY